MTSETAVDVAITIVMGYLVGSIPIANMVAARRAKIDLRTTGDGNPGFWNARETLGKRAAIPVFVGDVSKGVVAALIGAALANPGVWGLAYMGTGAAMVGHAFPVFARFRGGRSILTFVGGAAVYATVPFAITIALLLAVFGITRSFARAAQVGFFAFPIVQLVIEGPYRTAATGVLMTFIGLRFAMAAWSDHRAVQHRTMQQGSDPIRDDQE
jgi:glycerol-3-phosphate acyltransferase PlsY